MRLNRVLQITAAVGIATAVTGFTISCSEDGASGADGASCTVSGTATGYDVLCGGVKVGELASGGVGNQGPAGPVGPNGKDGTGCVLGDRVGDSYQVICDGQVKGSFGGCKITDDDINYVRTIECGQTSVSMCGPTRIIFNSEVEKCNVTSSGTYSAGLIVLKCEDGEGADYTPKTQYCGYANKAAFESGTITARTGFCGGPGGGKPNEEGIAEWKEEYCRVIKEVSPETGDEVYSFKVDVPTDCDSITTAQKFDPIAISSTIPTNAAAKTAYKGHYCGFIEPTDNSDVLPLEKSLQEGKCDDGFGPNEKAWQHGYCQVKDPSSVATTLVTDDDNAFCGDGRESINRVNETTYQYQYCGYTNFTDAQANKKTVQKSNITGLPAGTSSKVKKALDAKCASFAPNFDNTNPESITADTYEYCSVTANDKGEFDVEITSRADITNSCEGATGSSADFNKGAWNKDYCTYGTQVQPTKDGAADPKPTRGTMNCGFVKLNQTLASTKNEVEYCQVDSTGTYKAAKPSDNECVKAMNEGSWKKQYCGFASATAKTASIITAGSNQCAYLSPNKTQPTAPEEVEYCTADRNGVISLTTPSKNDCTSPTAKLNENKWLGQYCGYASVTATAKTVIGTFTDAKGGIACNLLQPNRELPIDALSLEYCQADIEGKLTLAKIGDAPCITKAPGLNEGTWKGEYCVGQFKVSCAGGLIANPDYDGTKATTPCVWPPQAAKIARK